MNRQLSRSLFMRIRKIGLEKEKDFQVCVCVCV